MSKTSLPAGMSLEAYLALPESEKQAIAQGFKQSKGVITVNAEKVAELNGKAGLTGTAAALAVYQNKREIKYLSLIVTNPNNPQDKAFFKLEGGRKAETHDAALVDIMANLEGHIADTKRNLAALEQVHKALSVQK
jgi:hypothetical protein